jgi:DNA-binding winged helix-turn-helix (wHTH) protein/Tol biopolymer transport system component
MPADLADLFEFGPFTLDAEDGSLRRGTELLHLPRRAADLLIVLIEEPGRVFSRDELIAKVWDTTVVGGSLDYQIYLVRQALAPEGNDLVQNVPRRGFRFTGTVRRSRRKNSQITDVDRSRETFQADVVVPLTANPQHAWRHKSLVIAIVVTIGVTVAVAAMRSNSSESIRVVESRAITQIGPPKIGEPLLTDGRRIYYARLPDSDRLAIPIGGGEPSNVFDAASKFHLADPGSGSEYLAIKTDIVGVEGELWVVPIGSGVPQRIGNLTAVEAVWSPDRRRIALVTAGRLRLVDSNGARATEIHLKEGGTALFPRWSPDGTTVRFTVNGVSDGTIPPHSLWEVGRDGGEPRKVFTDWDANLQTCCGVWTPDGQNFIFQVTRADRRMDLWVESRPRGLDAWLGRQRAPMPLTAGPLSLNGPALGADGKTIFAVGALYHGQLVRWDSQSQTFIPYLGGISGTWVSISPDQQWIAYAGYPDRKLWRSRVDGSDKRALVGGDFELDGVVWSPNGRWISFRSRMGGRRMKVYVMPSEGGEPQSVTMEDRDEGVASWSPDSTQLVFGDVPPEFGVPKGGEVIHVYDVHRKTLSSLPGSEGLWTARWSSDGRHIAALTIDNEQRMKLFDTQSKRWRSTAAVHVDNPSWTHDGEAVVYATEGGVNVLRRLNIETGRVVDLVTIGFMMPVYGWSGLAPDDSPLLLKNLTAPAVYALTVGRTP